MSHYLGTSAVLNIETVQVTNLKSVDFNSSVTAVDQTDNDNAGKKTFLPGDEDGKFSFVVNYDGAAASHTGIIALVYAKTQSTIIYYPSGNTSGQFKYTFEAVLTSVSAPTQHEAVVEMTVEGQITGGVTAAVITP